MKNATRCIIRIFACVNVFIILGNVSYAQRTGAGVEVAPARPDFTSPGYAERKALLASPTLPTAAKGPASAQRVSQLPACFEPLDRTTYTALPRDDDNYVGPIALGFDFLLFGTPYSSCYINNNGNITFGQGVSGFNSQGFPFSTPMVAAFWGDVDTRAPGSGQVWYKVYPDRLVVTWDQVSYYTQPATKTALTNTFQLVIRRNTGLAAAGADVGFAYGDMQWTTGNASRGTAGFGGNPATVGVNQGNGLANYIGTGRFNQNDATTPQTAYPGGTTAFSGVNWLDNLCIGYTVAPAGNLPPTAIGLPAGNALTLRVGETVTLPIQFAGPESGQTVQVTTDLAGLADAAATAPAPAMSPIVAFTVTGTAANVGTHAVSFVATDNGVPVQSQTFALAVTVVAPTSQWTGAVSKSYTDAGNWSAGAVPGASTSVTIPAGVPNFPLLTTAATAASFTVAPGASMTIGKGGELALSGSLNVAGALEGGAGALRAMGSTAQTLGGSGNLMLGELTVGSAGVRLASALDISRLLVLNGDLTTNGQRFRLLSDSTGTAMVVNNGAAVVQGVATVQRYIDPSLNAGTGYRHFASPVAGATLDALARPGFLPTVNPAFNTLGSSVVPFPTVFGYDERRVSASANPGSLDFDQGFFSPSATAEALAPARGYTANLPATDPLAALPPVSFTGPLHNGAYPSGPLSRGGQAQSGWHLLGNPYPAPLDWDAAYAGASNLENAVYVFKSSGPYAGSYASYVNGIGTARYIGVAQAFFVRATAANAQLTLTNAARVTAYQNPAFNRAAPTAGPVAGDARPQLRLELLSNGRADAAYVYFQGGATAGFDGRFDAYKLGGNPLYLATGTPGAAYSINGLPALTAAGAAVPLLTYLPKAGSFSLRLGELKNFGTATLQLEDRQTGRWYDLRQQPAPAFQVSRPDEAATRFVLHVNQSRALATTAAMLGADAVSVWPNPASGTVNLTVTALPAATDELRLSLLNLLGQEAARQSVPARAGRATASFDVSGLAPGVYTLRGTTGTHAFARNVVVN